MVGNKNIGEYGKATRFSSENQPKRNGRKPRLYKQLKAMIGQSVGHELEKEDYFNIIRFIMERTPNELELLLKDASGQPNKDTPIWVLNIISAINTDIRFGRTSTIEMIFDRVFGKACQPIEGELSATVRSNDVDLSALTTEELLQYNNLLEKIKGKDGKRQ